MSSSSATTHPLSGGKERRAAIEMTLAALSFATMGCIAHGLRDSVTWPAVACARMAMTVIVALIILRVYRIPLLIRGTRALWSRSISGSLGLLCTFYCFTHLPITDTMTIFATSPIWVIVILTVMFDHKPHRGIWWHAALALAGVYIMQRPTFDSASFPLLVAVAGSLVVSVAKVSMSRCRDLHPLSVVAHYSSLGFLVSLSLTLILAEKIVLDAAMPPLLWLWVIPMGLAGTSGQIMVTSAYKRGNPAMVAVVGISQIAFAAAYDVLVWDYTFDVWKIVGIVVIATSIFLSVTANAGAKGAEAVSDA